MRKPNAYNQYLGALMVAIPGFLYGITIGWSSPAVFLLTSNESPLPSGKISMEQASWITSLKSGFMAVGFIFVGHLAKSYGRKWPLICLSFPSIISWLLIIFAKNVYYVYVARILQGLFVAGVLGFGHMYLVEISNDSLRGALTSTLLLGSMFGIFAEFLIGTYFNYFTCPIFAIAINISFAVLFAIFFPETPLYLLKQNKILEAEKSVQFYKNIDINDRTLMDAEIERVKQQIDNVSTGSAMKWSELKNNLKRNPGRKAMIIGVFLGILNHFSGNFALVSYTANIFDAAGSFLKPNESALIVATTQFISTCLVPIFIEKAGRKVLYLISTMGSVLGLTILGIFLLLKSWHYDVQSFSWIPIFSISEAIAAQSLAIATLSFTVTAELLPENLREFGTSFCNLTLSVSAFIVLKFLPLLWDIIGLHGVMFLFSGYCLANALFILLYVPESKGKTYQEIMKSLQ